MARPPVPLLELVRQGRFDPRNARHRAKLRKDASLLEFVGESEEAPERLRTLAQLQTRFRCEGGWAAYEFRRVVEAGDEEPCKPGLRGGAQV
jgi:hypothetical protein